MTHGSLFSGVGGFDLAAKWMGWENKFHCEWDPFGQEVLKYYHPNAISYNDITTTDFSIWRGKIDILTGGFPCQPFSTAGKRKGTGDSRYLWPEMLRVIREVRPQWVVGENVYGLVNWDGGLVFDTVCLDLENEGFKVIPVVLPACGVNAPHQRYRIWFIAYRKSDGDRGELRGLETKNDKLGEPKEHREDSTEFRDISSQRSFKDPYLYGWGSNLRKENADLREFWDTGSGNHESISTDYGEVITDSQRIRQQGPRRSLYTGSPEEDAKWKASWSYYDGRWPLESPLCSRNDGFPAGLSGITIPKHRQESIKAYGNAIVPQLAYQIFKTIMDVQTTSGY